MSRVKIAAAQILLNNNPSDNASRICSSIEQAKSKGADFVCFPEGSLNWDEKEVKEIKSEFRQVKASAKKHSINVIFGSYVRKEDKIHNLIWIIDRNGRLVYTYSKKNLYVSERGHVVQGKSNKVLELDGVKFAVVNCWDYAFPEYLRSLAKKGAQIIFCPSYLMSHPRTKDVLDKVPQVRAFDTISFFLMVDGFVENETFKKSRICHPLRELAVIENKPGIIYADVDVSELDSLRAHFSNF